MTTLLEHLRDIALRTDSGAQNAVGDFRLVRLKRNISRPGKMLFEKGDYGLVPDGEFTAVTPIFSFRSSAMIFVGPDSLDFLPDDTVMPDKELAVMLAVRAPQASQSSPREVLDGMPSDEWVFAADHAEASATCIQFFETHDVTEETWWGGTIRDSATCVPLAAVRFDGSVWSIGAGGSAEPEMLYDPSRPYRPAI